MLARAPAAIWTSGVSVRGKVDPRWTGKLRDRTPLNLMDWQPPKQPGLAAFESLLPKSHILCRSFIRVRSSPQERHSPPYRAYCTVFWGEKTDPELIQKRYISS